jgi:hypothetical protein
MRVQPPKHSFIIKGGPHTAMPVKLVMASEGRPRPQGQADSLAASCGRVALGFCGDSAKADFQWEWRSVQMGKPVHGLSPRLG